MKKLAHKIFVLLLLFFGACTDRDIIESKDGVSLPPVSNLALAKIGDSNVRVSWTIPPDIPQSINQPLNVYVEVKQIIGVTTTRTEYSATLPNAPSQFDYELPDTEKTYHITVKLQGGVKDPNPNYSATIYSLGKTVIYAP